jgi:arginine/lysine/ornithine decarboxylase
MKAGGGKALSKLPIIEAVSKYVKENNSLFCTPGHKGGAGFMSSFSEGFVSEILKYDITEVEGLDNLQDPESIIKKSEGLLAKLYGSEKSYFLVNGSTSGNFIMIFSAFKEGDKILVERNCHKSILNAIIMRKLEPVFIRNTYKGRYNAPLSIDRSHFSETLKNHKGIKGAVITYPNYYGVCCDLAGIISECREANVKVLVDSAHGAHFGINKGLPESAVRLGADMVVMSAHKTLPSLTQTAYLHAGKAADLEKIRFYYNSFMSTSPSYLFLCSLEYARFYLETKGDEDYSRLLATANRFRDRINRIEHIHVIGREDIDYEIDATRYIINVEKGFSGYLLLDHLRKNGIQAEMSDGSNVILILSPFNGEEDFERLLAALRKCDFEELKAEMQEAVSYGIPSLKMLPHKALDAEKESVSFIAAAGRVCGESIVPYPPGIPLLMMGEEISKKHVEIIQDFIDNGVKVIGISESNKIVVVRDGIAEVDCV